VLQRRTAANAGSGLVSTAGTRRTHASNLTTHGALACPHSRPGTPAAQVSLPSPSRPGQALTFRNGTTGCCDPAHTPAFLAMPYAVLEGAVTRLMLQVIYSSASVAPFNERELAQLLMHARGNNTRLGVTGMLLYEDSSFLQVIEGDAAVLETLFQLIGGDKRHKRVMTLLRREVDVREFGDWAMGFVSPKHLTSSLPGYSDYLRLRDDPEKSASAAARVLAGFRAGRFRSYVTAG
jgi:FAD-dependent sensor of blue light